MIATTPLNTFTSSEKLNSCFVILHVQLGEWDSMIDNRDSS